MIEEDKKLYEMAFLLNQSLNSHDLEAKIEEFKKLITDLGGIIISAAAPKKQKLSYPIKKQNNGYFVYFIAEILPYGIKELREKLVYENAILRYMIFAKSGESLKKEKRLPVGEKIRKPAGVESKIAKETEEKQEAEEAPPEEKKIDLSELDKKLKEIFE